jgi:DHA2 family methylenomycin A resistance protein-like MFS transporter
MTQPGTAVADRRIDETAQLTACAVLALLTDALIAAGSGSQAHAACPAGTARAKAVLIACKRRSRHAYSAGRHSQ